MSRLPALVRATSRTAPTDSAAPTARGGSEPLDLAHRRRRFPTEADPAPLRSTSRTRTTRGRAVSDHKRSLGAYYSPEPYARVLVRWALAGRQQSVLDPSYGGCAVLRV